MAAEIFTKSLQENLVTVLAYNEREGRIVAQSLNLNMLDGEYRTVAERCVDYWKKYDKPPLDHTADLLDDILADKKNRRAKAVTRILTGIVHLADAGLNTDYIVHQMQRFERTQAFKVALLEAAEAINNKQHMGLEEAEELMAKCLRTTEVNFEAGTTLEDYKDLLAWQSERDAEFTMGIPALDRSYIRPARGKLCVPLAPVGRGKTWFAINVGAANIEERKKVLHISLEMPEVEVKQRYFQRLFFASKRTPRDPLYRTVLEVYEGKLDGLQQEAIEPSFSLDSPAASSELESRIHKYMGRYKNLRIKSFPSGSLSVDMLDSYLETLEVTENYRPDLIIIDYLGILKKANVKDLRGSMNENVVQLRGLLQRRDLAGVVPHQVSKVGAEAHLVKTTHVAEDWSIIMTADIVLTLTSSVTEFKLGLMRVFVGKARSDEDQFVVLITQSFATGQFCIDSIRLPREYEGLLKDYKETADSGDDAGADDEDDSSVDD